ncbi:MAG: DNA-directed RNA polymerase subunit B'' [Candidatus Marsarchaeota archaeon]|nr:DNA-directed RNA polymerase subunit B'' [Candidatus Marsarchaeota archaeon]
MIEVLDVFLNENSLSKQFIDSYNKFVDQELQKIIDEQLAIKPEVEGLTVKLGKIWVEKPYVVEADNSRSPLYPMEARLRDLTYSAQVWVEMVKIIDGVEKRIEDVYIGDLPVMVKSKLCWLYGKTNEELKELGEDYLDPGGYFIINGIEKAIVSVEDLAPNRIMVSRDKDKNGVEAKVFSTRSGFRAKCTVFRSEEGKMGVSMPSFSKMIDLTLVLKALGMVEVKSIINSFSEELIIRNDILLNLEGFEKLSREQSLEIIGKRVAPGQPLQYQIKRAELLLDHYLFPHIGVDEPSRILKSYYLCKMVEKTILVAYKKRKSDDRDHYSNKRLKVSGVLLEELFKHSFQFLVKDLTYQLERSNVRGRKLSLSTLIRPDLMSNKIKSAMGTGNWVGGRTGVCQPLDNTNFLSRVSTMRKVVSSLAKKHPSHKVRDLNGTHFGRFDPNESPEGPDAGLVKTLSLGVAVSIGTDEGEVEQALKGLTSLKQDKVSVFINGRFAGFSEDGAKLVKVLRDKRRKGELNKEVSMAFFEKSSEVFINSDSGRLLRPVFVVEGGKAPSKEVLKKLSWTEMISNGFIEYLDAEEEENAFISLNEKDLTSEHTHLEIDPAFVLSLDSNLLPFIEYISSPRILMALKHLNQSLGVYQSNFNLRLDTNAHVLHYPQKPLVSTWVYDKMQLWRRAQGQNVIVAILCYEGFNMDDGMVVNKASVQRGLFRSTFFRNYIAEERKYAGGQKDRFEVPPEFVQNYLGPEAYSKLDENGIVYTEVQVQGNDVLVGKTAPPRFLKENAVLDVETESRRENSLLVRSGESGIVDRVVVGEKNTGNRFVQVKVRTTANLNVGDKLSTRAGQKGINALLEDQENLPFNSRGIIPDLIINPLAIPSRMAAAFLLETLAGKSACVDGMIKDGTPFQPQKQDFFEETLKKNGFNYSGEEVFYDGRTGRNFKAKIFSGVVYFEKLHFLSSDKLHVRSRGPVQMLTRQPTEGKAREGGLKLGAMEKDCFVGFGAASIIKERMMDASDRSIELICNDCGSFAVQDYVKGKRYCPLCGSSDVREVETNYSFRLLIDEIKSIGIIPRLRLK